MKLFSDVLPHPPKKTNMKVKEFIEFINNGNFLALYVVSDKTARNMVYSEMLNCYSETYKSYTDIYKCEDGFVGVTGIIPEDEYTPEDIGISCQAEEYVAIPSIKYVPKSSIDELAFKH